MISWMTLNMSLDTVWKESIFEVFPGPSANEQGPDKTSDFDTFYTVRDEQLNLLISTINIMEMLALNLFLPSSHSIVPEKHLKTIGVTL